MAKILSPLDISRQFEYNSNGYRQSYQIVSQHVSNAMERTKPAVLGSTYLISSPKKIFKPRQEWPVARVISDSILDKRRSKAASFHPPESQSFGSVAKKKNAKPGRLEVLAITCGSLLELGFRVGVLGNKTEKNTVQNAVKKEIENCKSELTEKFPLDCRPRKRVLQCEKNEHQADQPPAKRCHSSPKKRKLKIPESSNRMASITVLRPVMEQNLQCSEGIQQTKGRESARVSNQSGSRNSSESAPTSAPRSPKQYHSPLKWTKEEDKRLEEGVKLYKLPNWKLIANHVRTRSNKVCAQRWRHNLRPEVKLVKKGKWTKDEDERLWNILCKYRYKNERTWDKASEGMGYTRNSIQCRERWKNFLDPSLRFGPWTPEEDECLLRLHAEFGKQWKRFTGTLIGRSAQRIRRRFAILENRQHRQLLYL